MLDLHKTLIKDLLKLKDEYKNLDCVVFFAFKDGFHIYDEIEKLPGNLSFEESKYENYNEELTDYEWNNIYREMSKYLSEITKEHGDNYRILIDLNQKEIRTIVEDEETETIKF